MVECQEIEYKVLHKKLCDQLKPISEDYLFEINQLFSHFLKADRAHLLSNNLKIQRDQCELLFEAVKKRTQGYPLQYILGEWDFYGRTFEVGEGVLIPRADTETLIEQVIDFAAKKSDLKVLDLCSGSGCIAITLSLELDNPNLYAVEKSEQAYEYLLKNISKNKANITPMLGDALSPPNDFTDFDIIVSNPPYLTDVDMASLQKEVSFEPNMALYGSEDGLCFYREITRLWKSRLKSGGLLAFEVGINQAEAVTKILKDNDFKTICQRRDLCDIIRVVSGRYSISP